MFNKRNVKLQNIISEQQDAIDVLKQQIDSLEKQIYSIKEQESTETEKIVQITSQTESTLKTREEIVEDAKNRKQLAWHMQYYYDMQFAAMEMKDVETICPGNKARLKSLENSHKGERCFIIGNGPSLKAEDLDLLKNEVTFGCNRIHLIFKETDWRPTFYCVTDMAFFGEFEEETRNMSGTQLDNSTKLFCSKSLEYTKTPIKDAIYFVRNGMYRETPEFSANAAQLVYEGGTVTYVEIQLAIYMGFKEIYLLGVDNSLNTTKSEDGRTIIDWNGQHFSKDYATHSYSANELNSWANFADKKASGIYDAEKSYGVAKWYADNNNVKICNATRGGQLEVFERASFDDLCLK